MAHGALSEQEIKELQKQAERLIDKDPAYAQLSEKLGIIGAELSRVAARNVLLEKNNALLEKDVGRYAAIALRGGVKIEACSQILGALPSLYDEELQEISLEINQEMKRRAEKKSEKRKTERRKTIEKSANGRHSP